MALFNDLRIQIEADRDQLIAIAYCPICGHRVESADHGLGEEHAKRVVTQSLHTHIQKSLPTSQGE